MQLKTDFRSKQAFSVHSGCRAGIRNPEAEAICEADCHNNYDFRSIVCKYKGWPNDGVCDQNQAILEKCLTNCFSFFHRP